MSPNTVGYLLAAGVAGVVLFAVFYGEEQGWGAGLTFGLSFGALIIAVIVFVIYENARKRRRRAAVPVAAAALGLVPETAGGPALPTMPAFHLTSQGQDRKAENVMSGQMGAGRIWLFDYTYATQGTSYQAASGTVTSSRYDHYFSCALGELPGALPAMRIGEEGFLSGLARGLGFEDVETGSPGFDRQFKVEAAVPTIAREVLDPPMQQTLASHGNEMTYEISDRWVLAYTKQRKPDELRPLLDAAQSFRDNLPRAVLERYARSPLIGSTPAPPAVGAPTPAAGLPSRARTPFTALLAMFVLVVATTVAALVAVAAFTEFEEPEMGVLLTIGAGVAAILAVIIPLWARSARRRRLEREAAATWGSGQPSAR